MAEGGAEPLPQFPGGVVGRGFAGAADQDHPGGGVVVQLVGDRLHDVLVADPGAGVDARHRQ